MKSVYLFNMATYNVTFGCTTSARIHPSLARKGEEVTCRDISLINYVYFES